MEHQPEYNALIPFACCALIFSPVPNRPQKLAPQLSHETKKPKLNSYERETNETASAPEKRCPSYDVGHRQAPQSAPNRPQNHLPQLRRKTPKSKLNSYERETNKTGNSYEKQTFSYDCCLTPICKSLQTRPQNHLPQLRRKTAKSNLNSYERETNQTGNRDEWPMTTCCVPIVLPLLPSGRPPGNPHSTRMP